MISQSGNAIIFNPGSEFNFLAIGETATVVIGYTVQDNNASPFTDAGTLAVTVNGTNDASTVASAIALATNEDEPLQLIDLLAGADDSETTDILSASNLILTGRR